LGSGGKNFTGAGLTSERADRWDESGFPGREETGHQSGGIGGVRGGRRRPWLLGGRESWIQLWVRLVAGGEIVGQLAAGLDDPGDETSKHDELLSVGRLTIVISSVGPSSAEVQRKRIRVRQEIGRASSALSQFGRMSP